jgi:hypothetical protein
MDEGEETGGKARTKGMHTRPSSTLSLSLLVIHD